MLTVNPDIVFKSKAKCKLCIGLIKIFSNTLYRWVRIYAKPE